MSQPFSLHDISVLIWWGQMHRTFMLSMLELGPPWNGISFLALTPPFITENVTPFFFIRKKMKFISYHRPQKVAVGGTELASSHSFLQTWNEWSCVFHHMIQTTLCLITSSSEIKYLQHGLTQWATQTLASWSQFSQVFSHNDIKLACVPWAFFYISSFLKVLLWIGT